MRAALLMASLGAHVGLVLLTPRGEPLDLPDRPRDPTPIELVEPIEVTRPEVPPPEPEPPPEPPPPEPPTAEPPPEPEPPPPPPRPRPRAAPQPTPDAAGPEGSVPVGEPTTTPPGEAGGDAGSDEPRRLDMTLSNRKDAKTSGGGRRSAPPKAELPKCTDVTKPRPKKKVPVPFTREARAARIEGRLVLRATVGRTGTVTDVTVVKSLGEPVDGPAAAALRAWTFEPATACGKPVEGRFTIARDFALGD